VALPVVALAGFGPLAHAAPSTQILGGSTEQRAVLQQILVGLGPTRIPQLRVVRSPGGVNLTAPVTRIRDAWEVLAVGAAFFDRSAASGLSPVIEIETLGAGYPTSTAAGTPRPPRATDSSVAATRRTMLGLAAASGAQVAELSVSRPDAIAIALRLKINDAASFLQGPLAALVRGAAAHESQYEGLFIEVDDDRGIAWANANVARLGGEDYVRPSLRGCDPFPTPSPPGPVPPCP
jgi:hypothetical protein